MNHEQANIMNNQFKSNHFIKLLKTIGQSFLKSFEISEIKFSNNLEISDKLTPSFHYKLTPLS